METLDLKNILADISFQFAPSKDFSIPKYQGLPFSSFNPLEKITKCCDFQTGIVHKSSNASAGKNIEEDEFVAIESKHELKSKVKKKFGQKPNIQLQSRIYNTMYASNNNQQHLKNPQHSKKNDLKNALYLLNKQQHTKTKFKESNLIKNNWIYRTDISKAQIEKMILGSHNYPKVETICRTGVLHQYNKAFDRVSPKYPKGISVKNEKITVESVTLEDNNLFDLLNKEMELAESQEGNSNYTVFTTEEVLTAIMTVKHSNFPWDLTAKKVMLSRCTQTTAIANEFKKQAFTQEKVEYSSEEAKCYKYQKFTFNNGTKFVVRLNVDSYVKNNDDSIQEISLKTFNEINTIGDWRYKLETGKGALISSEFLNNMCKVCKWLCQAYMSEIDTIKIAFISQNSPKENFKHSILCVESYKTNDLSKMINFNMEESWNLTRVLTNFLAGEEDGKYFLSKSSYKNSIRIFKMPSDEEEEKEEK